MIAQSRIETNPAASITASRTMVETALKTIIAERGDTPDQSGELGKLVKQAQDVLKFDRAQSQPEHQLHSGMANIIQGLSAISNSAGDRHGLVLGKSLNDPSLARLCLNAAGTIGLFFIELHLFSIT